MSDTLDKLEVVDGRSIDAIAKGYAERFAWLDPADAAITYLLLEIHPSLLAAAVRAFESVGQDHTRARYGILRSLLFADEGRLTHNALVDLLKIPPSTVTFLLDALEREALVERKPHPNRRAAWIHLTDKGKNVAEEMVEIIARSMHEMTSAALTDSEKEAVRDALARFLQASEAWSPDSKFAARPMDSQT